MRIKVIGHVREFQEKRSILAFKIIPVSDPLEVTYHTMMATAVHLQVFEFSFSRSNYKENVSISILFCRIDLEHFRRMGEKEARAPEPPTRTRATCCSRSR